MNTIKILNEKNFARFVKIILQLYISKIADDGTQG